MSHLQNFADLASVTPAVAAAPTPDSYLPAQPGTTAVVVSCIYLADDDAPTLADVRCDYPAVWAWRVRPPEGRNTKLTVEPVMAYSPFYADLVGQGAVVEILVPDDSTPGSPLRNRRYNGVTVEEAKRAVLADARARWRMARRRVEARQAPAAVAPVAIPVKGMELLAA